MAKQFEIHEEKTPISQGIVTGALIGAVAGTLIGLLADIRVWAIPGISSLLTAIPFNEIISGVILGIIAGGIIGSLIGLFNHENKMTPYDPYIKTSKSAERIIGASDTTAKMQLREERLDTAKSIVKTGDVNVHKEVHTEKKNIIVPVTREELVIEKVVFEGDTQNKTESSTETIRIPLR
ncbi:MAG: YsnF/AvaK domain-containing protein, partial [Bacillota bacterium]|nr:YsnF/AvaK domain-containing protein [Bacillota bacterium]